MPRTPDLGLNSVSRTSGGDLPIDELSAAKCQRPMRTTVTVESRRCSVPDLPGHFINLVSPFGISPSLTDLESMMLDTSAKSLSNRSR